MALYAYTEIVTIEGFWDRAETREEVESMLEEAWSRTGAWAGAVAAGDADEGMRLVAVISGDGRVYWNEE